MEVVLNVRGVEPAAKSTGKRKDTDIPAHGPLGETDCAPNGRHRPHVSWTALGEIRVSQRPAINQP